MRSNFFFIYFFLLALLSIKITAQEEPLEMWVKLSPEIRMNIEDSPLEFRVRPDDHIFLPGKYVKSGNQARADLMIGVNFSKFKLFSYTKYDESDAFWTGARLDFNFTMFNKKLLFNIQERFFWGLNEQAENHYYLVQYIRYKISKVSVFGLLSYGKWRPERDFDQGAWFLGPSLGVTDQSGLSLQLAVTKDVFHDLVYMTFVRIGYRFTLKNKSKIISIEEDEF